MNPTIDHPSTLARSKPSISITRATSPASFAMSNGFPSSVEPPIPRLSRSMSSFEDARPSMNEGSQSALVAAKPFRTNSGGPFPMRRQAIRPPSTGTVANNSAAIKKLRHSLRKLSRVEASRHLAESVNPQMANSRSTEQPAWQRNPVFEFFASLKLAVVLLAVMIVAAIAGTIYESSFDAKVARAYVYGAPWFNLWLVLLGANLACSALSRWPWRKHHLAFLITHLGIITLLIGSLIGRIWGVEGTITLFKGEPPPNRLLAH